VNILVAIEELDPSCHHHLEIASDLARAYGGGLLAFHAAAPSDLAHATRTLRVLAGNVSSEAAPYGEAGRAAAILEAAQRHGCDLVVIGTQGLDPFVGRFLDSPAHHVLEAGRHPVLVVHPERGLRKRGRRTVLAAMADPAFSTRVLQHGLHLAKALRAQLKVVHVGSREEDPVAVLLQPREAHPSQRMVAEAAAELTRAGVPSEGLVVPNYAGLAEELAHVADRQDADVIVIGSSGKLDLGQWMLGSIAEAVLHRSRRPVLVVPSLTL
jgi:nucleotide-binding universal stress UspA family protein